MRVLQHLILFTFLVQSFSSQAQDKNNGRVRFVATIDIMQATKDGIYLNNYVVNIPHDKLMKLNGKKVRISGKVTIIKGAKYYNDGEVRQGREENTKHILRPKIKIID
jgi:hypothetical protein